MSTQTIALIEGLKSRDLCAVQTMVSRFYPRALSFFSALMREGPEAQGEAIAFMRRACEDARALKPGTDLDVWVLKGLLAHWHGLKAPPVAGGEDFAAAFAILPSNERLALVLNQVLEVPARDCALVLGLSLNRLESHLRQGRTRLSEQIRKDAQSAPETETGHAA